jgi:fructan beta-fructosidase
VEIDTGAHPRLISDADFPYVLTNNDEPYRGQFHFTAPAGWLNDVNGIWYSGGTYHLSYQAYPYAIHAPGDTKLWGHATSPDLVHWTHVPIMLHPDVNVPGSAWSGSTVVDTNNTSGFRTGANPVFVTIYTATSIGTSVAYSNDLGTTWQAYSGNPVAIGGPNASTRDPHVFWHAASRRWICVFYENGTSFYTSPDLKSWTKVSHIDFGFECPDLYELPVDGNAANKRWVLQDASGTYLLGTFNGTAFTPDGTGAHKMDVSPQFYASQTFYRDTFPDQRVVQMAWIRGMDGATGPWNQSISFPAEVKLETRPEGIRVTRTPIAELSSLYGARLHWDAQSLAAGSNPFDGVTSRSYDLEVVIDVNASSARAIQLKVGSRTLVYDVAAHTLLGSSLLPINGRLKLRALVDWGQLEVFGNAGSFSYTEGTPFSATDTSVALTGDGTVSLVSAEFRSVRRAWPGTAAFSSSIIDDRGSGVRYTGSSFVSNEDRYFGGSCTVLRDQGSSVTAVFTGTRVDWYGLKNVDLGRADVYIDGAIAAAGIDCYSATRQNLRLFTASRLSNEPHTIKIVVAGTKADASSGTALVHDYFVSYVDR